MQGKMLRKKVKKDIIVDNKGEMSELLTKKGEYII